MKQNFWIPSIINTIRVIDFQYRWVPKGWSSDLHRHAIFEFIYIEDGEMEVQLNGFTYSLSKGDAILVKSGIYHTVLPVKVDTNFFDFHFELDEKRIHEILQRIQNPVIKSKSDNIKTFITEFIKKYGDFLKQFVEETKNDSMYSAITLLEVQSSILHLISLIANYFYHNAENMNLTSIHPAYIQLAHESSYLIEKEAINNLKISDLANMLNVDRSYLSNCFKKVYGISPQTYLINVRIRKAKDLLIDTGWSIESIAQKLNFSSTAHFSKHFSKVVGLSPFKFRNHSKQSN